MNHSVGPGIDRLTTHAFPGCQFRGAKALDHQGVHPLTVPIGAPALGAVASSQRVASAKELTPPRALRLRAGLVDVPTLS